MGTGKLTSISGTKLTANQEKISSGNTTISLTSAKWQVEMVAYYELASSLMVLLPAVVVLQYNDAWPSRASGWDMWSVGYVVLLRGCCAVGLLGDTFEKCSKLIAPYLIAQLMAVFVVPYAITGLLIANKSPPLRDWPLCSPFICLSVYVEYYKWKTVYCYYDLRTRKTTAAEFAKKLQNQTSTVEVPATLHIEKH